MGINLNPVVAEQIFNVPVEVVWKAITDTDQMRQWFFEPMTQFKAEPGFETQFVVHCEGTDYLHVWKVTEVVPLKRISYSWRYGGFPGHSTVVWVLSETPHGTRLVLTHEGGESFPQDNPVFSREAGQRGWDYFLCESLKNFLARSCA